VGNEVGLLLGEQGLFRLQRRLAVGETLALALLQGFLIFHLLYDGSEVVGSDERLLLNGAKPLGALHVVLHGELRLNVGDSNYDFEGLCGLDMEIMLDIGILVVMEQVLVVEAEVLLVEIRLD